MSKIKIKVTLKNSQAESVHELEGVIQDNAIKYFEKDNTKVIYNYKNHTLKRENNEIKMTIYFDKNLLRTTTKDLKETFDIEIKTTKIKNENHNLEIEYEISDGNETDTICYRIEEIK